MILIYMIYMIIISNKDESLFPNTIIQKYKREKQNFRAILISYLKKKT